MKITDQKTIILSLKKIKRGAYVDQIAHQLGVSYQTVYSWCKKTGVPVINKQKSRRIDWDYIKSKLA